MKLRTLTETEQNTITKIALEASHINTKLNYAKCYTITLLYNLVQFSGLKLETIPPDYQNSVRLLYKNPITSYMHYRTEIFYSKDPYANAIKEAEINVLGDDPRCPWLQTNYKSIMTML